MSKSPRVSVLMTIFNGGQYLQQALESLELQEYTDWELVVVDNASEDNSMEILEANSDSRFRITKLDENIGRTGALNLGLGIAQGDYIAILDADDLALGGRLSKQVDFMDNNLNVGLVGSWTKFIDENGKSCGEFTPPRMHNELISQFAIRNPIVHSSAMYRRMLSSKIGGYNSNWVYAQDFHFVLNLSTVSRIEVMPEYLCAWRKSSTGLTSNYGMKLVRSLEEAQLIKCVPKILKLNRADSCRNFKQQLVTRGLLAVRLIRERKILLAMQSLTNFSSVNHNNFNY